MNKWLTFAFRVRSEVDIWSLGVIFYALVTGSLPFDDDDEGVMKEMILKCEYEIPNWLDEGKLASFSFESDSEKLMRMEIERRCRRSDS